VSSVPPLSLVCTSCRAANPSGTAYCLRCGTPLGLAASRVGEPDLSRPIADWSVFGVQPAFVGREAELGALLGALQRARTDRCGTLALLRGPVGSGRSRLLARVHDGLEERGEDSLVLQAVVRPDDVSPWAPVAELLRQRFYLPRDADAGTWRDHLQQGARALLGPERGPDVAGLLIRMLGHAEEAGDDVPLDSALDALADLLRADAAREPMVVALDDADQGPAETRRLAGLLFPRLRSSPLVLVAVCGADTPRADFGVRDDDDGVVEIVLQPLDDDDVRTHVRGLLRRCGDVPGELLERIVEHAFGSPLAAEEIVRILIAEGVIDVSGDEWMVQVARLPEVPLPQAFDDVIRARLACLSPDQHDLLVRAALIGEVFWPGALLAALRGDTADAQALAACRAELDERSDIQARLEALAALDMVRRLPARDRPGEPAWRFKHTVERRLLAESAPGELGAHVHQAAADWLLLAFEEPPEQILAAIAEHYEFGGRPDRAGPFFAALADRFSARWAHERARDLYLRALWVVDPADTALRLRLLHDLGSTLHVLGALEESLPILAEMAELAWRRGNLAKSGVAFNKLGRTARSLGRYDEAVAHLDHALRLFETVDDRVGVAMTLDDLGRVDWLRGDYDAAHARYVRALELRRESGQRRAVATSLHHLGTLLVHRGEFREALTNFREALELLREVGDLRGISETLNAIGVILLERGEAESALKLWREALDSAEKAGDRVQQATVLDNLGELALGAGRLDEAAEALQRAIEIASAAGERRILADATRNLAALEGRRGSRSLALTLADEALQLARDLGSRSLEGPALRTLAELHGATVWADDPASNAPDPAGDLWKGAIAVFEEIGNTAELARTWLGYGTALVERGDVLQGRRYLEMARDVFERLEMRRVLGETRELIAQI
jgi:tetratricopeptide (TPR) repeat protein